jgi:hypothetical protein
VNTKCAIVRVRLPGVDCVDELGGRLVAHVEICLRCQAEAARYRSLRRRLGAVANEVLVAPSALAPGVIARIEPPETEPLEERRTALRRVAVAVSAAAGAAVAATAGTIIVVGLRRSHNAA